VLLLNILCSLLIFLNISAVSPSPIFFLFFLLVISLLCLCFISLISCVPMLSYRLCFVYLLSSENLGSPFSSLVHSSHLLTFLFSPFINTFYFFTHLLCCSFRSSRLCFISIFQYFSVLSYPLIISLFAGSEGSLYRTVFLLRIVHSALVQIHSILSFCSLPTRAS
jgi:hypothetical protein